MTDSKRKAVVILLNPHGSDETTITASNIDISASFLTHTVQMKLPPFEKKLTTMELLNPHGSDETIT